MPKSEIDPTVITGVTTSGTSSPVLSRTGVPGYPSKVICDNCTGVSVPAEAPKYILPAVPDEPRVPVQPEMVSVLSAVQLTPLLAEKFKEWTPVPR